MRKNIGFYGLPRGARVAPPAPRAPPAPGRGGAGATPRAALEPSIGRFRQYLNWFDTPCSPDGGRRIDDAYGAAPPPPSPGPARPL